MKRQETGWKKLAQARIANPRRQGYNRELSCLESSLCTMKYYLRILRFLIFAFLPLQSFSQLPEIYIIDENRDGADKRLRFIVSFKYIDAYSLEVHSEAKAYDGYIITHLSRTKISKTEYDLISDAIESSIGLPNGDPYESLGGFHWKFIMYGIRGQIRSENYVNANQENYINIRNAILNCFGFLERRRINSIY